MTDTKHPWLECRTAERGPGKSEILVRILKDRLPAGVNTASVVFQTTSSIRPSGAIYVKIRGVCDLIPSVNHVLLVKDQPKRVIFNGRDGKPVRIISAEPTNRNIQVEVAEENTLELRNPSSVNLLESVTVRVVDSMGRTSNILVSTF